MGSKNSGRRAPRQLKIVRGTFRKDRNPAQEPEPTKVAHVPSAPAYLGRHAKAHWKKIASELVRAGVLTTVDLGALEILCSAYGEFREAYEAVYTDARGNERSFREYMRGRNSQTMPEYNAMKAAKAEYKAYATEFGITPSSRNRLELKPKKGETQDPMEALLQA